MNCSDLAARLQKIQPEATPIDVARLCLLLLNSVDDVRRLEDPDFLFEAWAELNLRLHAAIDQHAAVTDELQSLAKSDPRNFTPDQIWILVRAIKVQTQVLRLYSGENLVETA